jgi:C-terminal processing protease CtpA/Prc
VKRLPGNVGHIEVTAVDEAEYTAEVVAAAMGLVANTSALILDLRRNTGGAPSGVAFWCRYFFPPEPVHLNDVYCRAGDQTQQYWTLPHLPGRRYLERPVYVLTSGRTFSGAEELAYNLKTLERATLVGERTRGGANPVEAYQLSPFFEVRVPTCRAINPITGTNWEGVGVEPRVGVPAAEALGTAHALALGAVLAGLGDAPVGPYAVLAEEARTALAELGSRDGSGPAGVGEG